MFHMFFLIPIRFRRSTVHLPSPRMFAAYKPFAASKGNSSSDERPMMYVSKVGTYASKALNFRARDKIGVEREIDKSRKELI